MTNTDEQDKYLYFSSQELISYFMNNIKEKDIKTQCKRILEMARVFMAKKDFRLEDIYSVAVMVRDINCCSQIQEVFRLYFKPDSYPIRVIIEMEEIDDTSDVEMEFSAYRGERKFINTDEKESVSQAVIIESFVHTSGIGSFILDKPFQNRIDLGNQVRQSIENLKAILTKSGSSLEQAYSLMLYMKDISLLSQIEDIFAEYTFLDQDISQRVIQVKQVENGFDIAISCSANIH